MIPLRLAIIVGSTRPGRRSPAVAEWVLAFASERADMEAEIVDVAAFDLPFYDEPVPPMSGQYEHAHTKAWSATIAAFDAYVFVTPEYNHSTSAVLKNAIDFLYHEWTDKVAGFVSYGVDASGARAIEHLRTVMGELKIADVHMSVPLSLLDDFPDGVCAPRARPTARLDLMLDELVQWGRALRTLRNERTASVPQDAVTVAEQFVAEIQSGLDQQDATVYNRHFAPDVMWGTPFGATIAGYDDLHAIHTRLLAQGVARPGSRYELVHVQAVAPDVVVAHVRRRETDDDDDGTGGLPPFSEMALYVLVRRDGEWWLAAGQNTPIRDKGDVIAAGRV